MVASVANFAIPIVHNQLKLIRLPQYIDISVRVLGIDPGEKNIGIAISDPTGTIANPLCVLKHISRSINAGSIAKIVMENSVKLIVVGQALNLDGKATLSGRRSARLAAAIRTKTDIQVILTDESYSTLTAKRAQVALNTKNRRKKGHLDELAATVILQTYLDSRKPNP
jgi:putative Holliday junction resolvase